MKQKISLKKIWVDEDLNEFRVSVSDELSTFVNDVYIDIDFITTLVTDLNHFKDQIYGGIYDIEMGAFGHEYASGAFLARLHFYENGKLCISTRQQSSFEEFGKGKREEASEAKMYLYTEPALLDNFIAELEALAAGKSDEAVLACA